MKNLQTKVHALDQEQTRQQELIYSAEFQIQQMERKVARGMGERTDEEKSQLNAKIRELEVSHVCRGINELSCPSRLASGRSRVIRSDLQYRLSTSSQFRWENEQGFAES